MPKITSLAEDLAAIGIGDTDPMTEYFDQFNIYPLSAERLKPAKPAEPGSPLAEARTGREGLSGEALVAHAKAMAAKQDAERRAAKSPSAAGKARAPGSYFGGKISSVATSADLGGVTRPKASSQTRAQEKADSKAAADRYNARVAKTMSKSASNRVKTLQAAGRAAKPSTSAVREPGESDSRFVKRRQAAGKAAKKPGLWKRIKSAVGMGEALARYNAKLEESAGFKTLMSGAKFGIKGKNALAKFKGNKGAKKDPRKPYVLKAKAVK